MSTDKIGTAVRALWDARGDDEAEMQALSRLNTVMEEVYTAPPERACHWCGRLESEHERNGCGPLVEIHVSVAEGEDAAADVTRYACLDDLETVAEKLVELGFGEHRHGGSSALEETRCPDPANCPETRPFLGWTGRVPEGR